MTQKLDPKGLFITLFFSSPNSTQWETLNFGLFILKRDSEVLDLETK